MPVHTKPHNITFDYLHVIVCCLHFGKHANSRRQLDDDFGNTDTTTQWQCEYVRHQYLQIIHVLLIIFCIRTNKSTENSTFDYIIYIYIYV